MDGAKTYYRYYAGGVLVSTLLQVRRLDLLIEELM